MRKIIFDVIHAARAPSSSFAHGILRLASHRLAVAVARLRQLTIRRRERRVLEGRLWFPEASARIDPPRARDERLESNECFMFLFQVATRPWSPDQGKTREMTKLCNHKRKLLLPITAASSPVASCTTAVSSSTLSSGQAASAAHVNADSPASPDKPRKGKNTRPCAAIPLLH